MATARDMRAALHVRAQRPPCVLAITDHSSRRRRAAESFKGAMFGGRQSIVLPKIVNCSQPVWHLPFERLKRDRSVLDILCDLGDRRQDLQSEAVPQVSCASFVELGVGRRPVVERRAGEIG